MVALLLTAARGFLRRLPELDAIAFFLDFVSFACCREGGRRVELGQISRPVHISERNPVLV
jgi:hypothetical protein